MSLPWDKLVGLTTDGAPAMCRQKSGLVGRIQEKMQEEDAGELPVSHCIIHQEALCGKALLMEHVMSSRKGVVNLRRAKGLNHRHFKSFLEELDSESRDVPYHTEVRWLSRGKELNRCFELREQICQFLENKGKDSTELRAERFLSAIVSHLHVLNLQLQGRGHIITDMYAALRPFTTKLCLWKPQMLQGNLAHFPCCQTTAEQMSPAVLPSAQSAEQIHQFSRPFADFEAQKGRFELLRNPFGMDVESAPSSLQMELIELQCNDMLKSESESVGAARFPCFLPDTRPQ